MSLDRRRAATLHFLLGCLFCWHSARADTPAGLVRHQVASDGHGMVVWSKAPVTPKSVILLVHGRTWSTRPDFDLQVPGEDLSLMDGLVGKGSAVYGVDLRGYGETPRDASGWLTPDRAAADVANVLRWVANRHPELPVPYLFGWSYGSMVSQLMVQNHPELTSGLMLFGYPIRDGMTQPPADVPAVAPRHPTMAEAAASDFIVAGNISERAVRVFVNTALRHDPVRADWRKLDQWQQLNPKKVIVSTLLLPSVVGGEHDPL
ncbi:MAG: alpha/beta fold hydrolase, partial [Gammaproteobacteria bacterium]|nr:alpha/beta fold hydrolase [Gammaproteobacteria bacterium]